MQRLATAAFIFVVGLAATAATAWSRTTTTVFSTDFETGLPAEFTAPGGQVEPVQGWSGLGPSGYAFGGSFLRYTALELHDTRLSLTGLPSHTHLDLRHMLAVIDSWDGSELLQILVDGSVVFSHWFSLATEDTTSYVPAPGTLLSAGANLGFTNSIYHFRDRAYNLAVEPTLLGIPHTASSAEIVWRISAVSGPAAAQWQGGADESWAIENVAVDVTAGVADADDRTMFAFGIARVASPTRGPAIAVEFRLPSAAPATLELLDVAGRRVVTREVGSRGAGQHRVVLDSGRDLAAGVYVIRLVQEGRAEARRVVVLD
jgi:hypothetical protein